MGLEKVGVWDGVVVKVKTGTFVRVGSGKEEGLREGGWVAEGRPAKGVGTFDNNVGGINDWQATHIPKITITRYR